MLCATDDGIMIGLVISMTTLILTEADRGLGETAARRSMN